MGKKKPKAPVHSAEYMLREQAVVPVWQPQINEQWKYNIYKQSVRLPSIDFRQPLAKTEVATNGTRELPSDINNKFTRSFTPTSRSKSQSQAKVKLPSASTKPERSDINKQLPATHTKPPFPRRTRARGGHVRLSSRKQEFVVANTSKHQHSRHTRDRGHRRNAKMRQAKLRYEQEKLAMLQDQQNQPDSLGKVSDAFRGGVGRASPVPSLACMHQINSSSPQRHGSAQRPAQPIYPRQSNMAHRSNGLSHNPNQLDTSFVRRQDHWSHWLELRVKVFGLPATVTTLTLWQCFSREGAIDAIEIFEDSRGTRDGKASIRYR